MEEYVVSAPRGPFGRLLQLIVNRVGHGAALYSAGSAAGLVDQGLFAGFAVLPLLALLGAVVVSRLLVPRIVFGGCGLAAAVLPGCRGWWLAGLRHRGSFGRRDHCSVVHGTACSGSRCRG
jgi:hypothetical protein